MYLRNLKTRLAFYDLYLDSDPNPDSTDTGMTAHDWHLWVMMLRIVKDVSFERSPESFRSEGHELLKSKFGMHSLWRKLNHMKWNVDRISRFATIASGIMYGVARVVILALAFAALRAQDERVYVETWTNNLPKIS
jgi:hypothetical protein